MPEVAVSLSQPRDEQVFEDLCLALFNAIWQSAKLYGRRGHAQKDIESIGYRRREREVAELTLSLAGSEPA